VLPTSIKKDLQFLESLIITSGEERLRLQLYLLNLLQRLAKWLMR